MNKRIYRATHVKQVNWSNVIQNTAAKALTAVGQIPFSNPTKNRVKSNAIVYSISIVEAGESGLLWLDDKNADIIAGVG